MAGDQIRQRNTKKIPEDDKSLYTCGYVIEQILMLKVTCEIPPSVHINEMRITPQ